MNYFMYTSHHFTPHRRYELNKLASLPMCGFIAQLVEHRTGIAEATGWIPLKPWFFQASSFQLLYCDDHSSLWSTTTIQIYELFHIYFTSDKAVTENGRRQTNWQKADQLLFTQILKSSTRNYCEQHQLVVRKGLNLQFQVQHPGNLTMLLPIFFFLWEITILLFCGDFSIIVFREEHQLQAKMENVNLSQQKRCHARIVIMVTMMAMLKWITKKQWKQ